MTLVLPPCHQPLLEPAGPGVYYSHGQDRHRKSPEQDVSMTEQDVIASPLARKAEERGVQHASCSSSSTPTPTSGKDAQTRR